MSKAKALLEQIGRRVDESIDQAQRNVAQVVEHPARGARFEGRTRARDAAEIELDRIVVDPQHREQFDEGDLKSLARDMQVQGLIQPIVVRWDGRQSRYVIIAGERRFRAAALLGWKRIECRERPETISAAEIAEIQLAENFARRDLNPIELARAFQDVIQKNDWTARELASRLGVNETTITRQLRCLKLPDDIQQQIASGEISRTAAREIARLKTEKDQRALLEQSKREGLKSAEVAAAVSDRRQPRSAGRNRRNQTVKPCSLFTEHGRVLIQPDTKERVTYELIEHCLEEALEEVRLRVRNRVTY